MPDCCKNREKRVYSRENSADREKEKEHFFQDSCAETGYRENKLDTGEDGMNQRRRRQKNRLSELA